MATYMPNDPLGAEVMQIRTTCELCQRAHKPLLKGGYIGY